MKAATADELLPIFNSDLSIASDKLILIKGLKDSLITFEISTDPVQLELFGSELFFWVSIVVIRPVNCCACTSTDMELWTKRNETKKTVPASNANSFL
jgi:hypothetical protein